MCVGDIGRIGRSSRVLWLYPCNFHNLSNPIQAEVVCAFMPHLIASGPQDKWESERVLSECGYLGGSSMLPSSDILIIRAGQSKFDVRWASCTIKEC